MAQGLGHDTELRIELRAWTTICKLSQSSEKSMQVGRGEASKFWLGVGVKIRIFYVMGLQRYGILAWVRIKIFYVFEPQTM